MKLLAAAIIAALLAPMGTSYGRSAAPAAHRAFTAAELVSLKRASSPQVSPDGQRVAFVVRETELEANRARTAIWMLDLAAKHAVPHRVTYGAG